MNGPPNVWQSGKFRNGPIHFEQLWQWNSPLVRCRWPQDGIRPCPASSRCSLWRYHQMFNATRYIVVLFQAKSENVHFSRVLSHLFLKEVNFINFNFTSILHYHRNALRQCNDIRSFMQFSTSNRINLCNDNLNLTIRLILPRFGLYRPSSGVESVGSLVLHGTSGSKVKFAGMPGWVLLASVATHWTLSSMLCSISSIPKSDNPTCQVFQNGIASWLAVVF